MTSNVYKVVAWERSNKLGKWCPYSAEVCQFLEESLLKDLVIVHLGDVDEELTVYSVNLKEMMQVSDTTGTKLPVRRCLFDNLCVLRRGFSWQWLDHDVWNTYAVDVNDFIDSAFLEGKNSISLNRKFPNYNYEIVFSKMIQINKHSKRKRKVRRQENSSPYPVVNCEVDDQANDTKDTDVINGIQDILTPEFLAKEVPGTSALLNQVNAYKRSVECSKRDNTTILDMTEEETTHDASSKHQKVLTSEEQDKKPNFEQGSSTCSSTFALVDGKPWTDSRPPYTPESRIKPVPGIEPLPNLEKPKRSKRKGKAKKLTGGATNILEQYTEIIVIPSEMHDEACIICCESLSAGSSYDGDNTVSKLTLCSHMFHKSCLEAMYNSGNKEFLQCPSCKQIHGEKCGTQPPGEMIYHVLPYSLPGYPENGTIRIIYDIHSGIQGPEHPNPRKRYTARGFPRHCYLPDNEMGRKILRLLIKAWKRRLIFTVGQSSTTGEENTVTWNEIHHKTEFGCNRRGHGYPDENYFSNVLAELDAHGIKDDEVRVWYPA